MPGIVIQITGDGAGAAEALKVIEERMEETAEKGQWLSRQLAEAGERIKRLVEYEAIAEGMRLITEGIQEVLEKSVELGVEIGHMSAQTGISTENLSELKYVSGQTGIEFEVLSKGFKKLSTDLYEMGQGAKAPAKAFKNLGISQKELNATGGDLMKVTELIADAFAKMPDGFQKNAIATELFGRAGAQLIPVLNQGSQAFERWRGEAESLGMILSQETVERLEDMHKSSDKLKESLSGLALMFTAALSPAVQRFDENLMKLIQDAKADPWNALREWIFPVASDAAPVKPKSQDSQKWWQMAGMSAPPTAGKSLFGDDPEADKKATEAANRQAEIDGSIERMIAEATKRELAALEAAGQAKLKLAEAQDSQELAQAKGAMASRLEQLDAEHKAGLTGEAGYLEQKLKLDEAANAQDTEILRKKQAQIKGQMAGLGADDSEKKIALETQLVEVQTKLNELSQQRSLVEQKTADAIAQQTRDVMAQYHQQAQQKTQQMLQTAQGGLDKGDSLNSKMASQAAGTIGGFMNGLTQMAIRGKMSFKDLADSAISDLERFAMKVLEERTIIPLLNQLFGLGGGAPNLGNLTNPISDSSVLNGELTDMIPFDAGGGDISDGGMAVVGDGGDGSGSELFAPKGPGTVLPHDVLEGIAKGGSGGGGGAPNVTINNVNNSNSPVQMRSNGVSWDGEAKHFVIHTILEDMQSGGPTSQALRGIAASGG